MSKKTLINIALLLLFIATGYYVVSMYITLDQIKEHSVALKKIVEQQYAHAVFIYITVVTLVVVCQLPITIPLTLVAGFLFGLWGIVYATVAIVLGCVIAFMLFRYLFASYIRRHYRARLTKFNTRMQEYGPLYLLLLHYSAVFPLFVINSLASLTPLSLPVFTLVTTIGILPVVSIYAYAGKKLSSIHAVQDIFSIPVIAALAMLMLLAFVPIIIKRIKGSAQV